MLPAMNDRTIVVLEDARDFLGPLDQFSPHAVMREIGTDVAKTIARGISFVTEGSVGEGAPYAFENTFTFIGNELNGQGISLDESDVTRYGKHIIELGKRYVGALSTDYRWATRASSVVEARWGDSANNIEVLVQFGMPLINLPSTPLEEAQLSEKITVPMLTITRSLMGYL